MLQAAPKETYKLDRVTGGELAETHDPRPTGERTGGIPANA